MNARGLRRRFLGGEVYRDGVKIGDVVSWGTTEEKKMDTIIRARQNPYRGDGREEVDLGWTPGSIGRAPRRFDTENGPGLTAADIDLIARHHFADGHAAAERTAEKQLEELRAELADAFDRGYTAGRVERAQGLARDVHARLFEPRSVLIEAKHGPKSKMPAALERVEAALEDVTQFVAGLFVVQDPAAEDRAAAQVARDEA